MNSKRILITGANGFIGSHLAKQLSGNNEVVAFDKAPAVFREGLHIYCGNVARAKDLDSVKGDFDLVYHFGSPSSVLQFEDNLETATQESVTGFLNIMNFAIQRNAKKIIYPSSGAVYRADGRKREINPVNIYGAIKLLHERIAQTYENRIATFGLRIFMGYGPGEEAKGGIASPVFHFLNSLIHGKELVVWGDGTQKRDLIYIDDICEVLVKCGDSKISGIVSDLGTGQAPTFNDLIGIVSTVVGKTPKLKYIPPPKNYLSETLANPTFTEQMLSRHPIDATEGIRRFSHYLMNARC